MDNALCSEEYKAFREKLQGNVTSPKEMAKLIGEALPPVIDKLNIGCISAQLMSPTNAHNKNPFCGTVAFYENPIGYEQNALIETFRTGENGLATFRFHPIKNHKFTESEIEAIKLLALDMFILSGRARLMGMVKQASITDPMTGIANMPSLIQKGIELKISRELANYSGLFINFKNYKYINSALSSSAGDQGIITYARAAAEYLESCGFIARLGGDNFFAIVHKDKQDEFIQKFSHISVATQIGPKPIKFSIHARMGVYPVNETDTMSEILHNGSIALAEAKRPGSKDIVIFTDEMLEHAMHEKQVSATFQEAFKNGEFIVYYQPKIHLEQGKLHGCEALVRWNKGSTIVPPADFLPILEKETTICQLDFFVFEQVCKDLRSWIDAGYNPVRVSSNFSKVHLRNPNLADSILGIMNKYNISSDLIEIELTEVSDFEDNLAMHTFVNTLRGNGVSVSIDDFGTGYSTLNVLTNFNVNVIKLDKSLLDNIDEKQTQEKIVLKNMVGLMNELNKEVVAEGVENSKQLEFLRDINCKMVQGFIYDKPLPKEEFEKRLQNKHMY